LISGWKKRKERLRYREKTTVQPPESDGCSEAEQRAATPDSTTRFQGPERLLTRQPVTANAADVPALGTCPPAGSRLPRCAAPQPSNRRGAGSAAAARTGEQRFAFDPRAPRGSSGVRARGRWAGALGSDSSAAQRNGLTAARPHAAVPFGR
jgi:hypothetical protein